MQIIISKTLILAAEKNAIAQEQLQNMLVKTMGIKLKCAVIEIGLNAWEQIEADVAKGNNVQKGGSIVINGDNLIISIDDEFIMDVMEAYGSMVNMLLPAAMGFFATLKVAVMTYQGKINALGKKYFNVTPKGRKAK